MPLKPGYSRATVNANIKLMRDEDYPHDQATAASLEHARESYFKRYPSGFLPPHLILPNGKRDRASWDRYHKTRRNNPIGAVLNTLASGHYLATQATANPCGCRGKNPVARPTLKALAADLLREYHDNCEPAACKLFDKFSRMHDLLKKDEAVLKREFNALLEDRKPNPVPPSKVVQRRNAADLYTRFTGHEALEEVTIDKPVLPDVMLVVGDIDGIMYTTVRDGVTEKYVHQFKKKARPLFCVSHDGKQIYLVGGEYDFTERGIVDRT